MSFMGPCSSGYNTWTQHQQYDAERIRCCQQGYLMMQFQINASKWCPNHFCNVLCLLYFQQTLTVSTETLYSPHPHPGHLPITHSHSQHTVDPDNLYLLRFPCAYDSWSTSGLTNFLVNCILKVSKSQLTKKFFNLFRGEKMEYFLSSQ